jgi:hypothetical protein
MIRKPRTMTRTERRLMLHACPRCQGDLFHDDYEDEFVCLQCGRRAPEPAALTAPVEAPAELTRAA